MKKEKKNKKVNIPALLIVLLFVGSTFAAIAVPIFTKDEVASEQKALEELLKEQSQVESETDSEPKEVDPNLKQEGDITSMQIIDLVTGNGQEAKLGNTISVKYKGALASSGEIFDSNQDGVEFPLNPGGLIEGWIEGVPGMKVGGKRKLVIPSEKGYGAQGTNGIPPNADLVFEIELISVSEAAPRVEDSSSN